MQQQQEQQVRIDQTLPLTLGSAELSIFAHQWDFPHLDTPSSDLQEEVPLEEEVAADSREEVEAASQVEEDPLVHKEILKGVPQEINSSETPHSYTMETQKGQKNS